MSKLYLMKIDKCMECPKFEDLYKSYSYHCCLTNKKIKYNNYKSEKYLYDYDRALNELFEQCPLMDWVDEKIKGMLNDE